MKKDGSEIHENKQVIANWINDFNLTYDINNKLRISRKDYLEKFKDRYKN